jgi:2-furoyl-CoA dehydrogenase large subunit
VSREALRLSKAGDTSWIGQSVERIEDLTLLAGRGRYIDDIGIPPGTLHAAILRSAHAHA